MFKGTAIVLLRNMIECLNTDLSCACSENCEECTLFYAQGNLDDTKEYLQMALEALEKDFNDAEEA